MSVECPYCGAEMSEMDAFCTKCGLGTKAYAPVDPKENKNKKRKFRWWIIPLAIILAVALLVILLWSRLSLYFAPELQLVEAMTNTASDFSERLEGSPLAVISQSVKWENGYTATVNIDLSVVGYDGFGITVSSAVDPESGWNASSTQQKIFGRSSTSAIYTGKDSVVFVLETSDSTEAYSVSFDDFDRILDTGIFSGIKDEEMESFRTGVESLHQPSDSDRADINKRYAQVFLDTLKESSRTTGYEKRMLEGRERSCGVISYSLNNYVLAKGLEDLAKIADEDEMLRGSYQPLSELSGLDLFQQEKEKEVMDIPYRLRQTAQKLQQDREGGITVTFHLCEKKLVRLCLERQTQGNTDFSLDAELGMDTSSGDILAVVKDMEGQKNILLQTAKSGAAHSDTIRISSQNGVESVSWTWDPASGDLPVVIVKDGQERVVQAILSESQDGFALELPDVLSAVDSESVTGMGMIQSFARLDANIAVKQGADIQAPEGKPLDQWTEKELRLIISEFMN